MPEQPQKQNQPQLAVKHKFSQLPEESTADPAQGYADPSLRLDAMSVLHDTYYLCLTDQYEMAGAREWMLENAPEVPWGNLLTELPLDRLSPRSVIAVLARKGSAFRPVKPAVVDGAIGRDGYARSVVRDPKELAKEFGAYGPIEVKNYWSAQGNRFTSGLMRDKLVDEIVRLSMPYSIGWRDASETDKHAKPNKLFLKSV